MNYEFHVGDYVETKDGTIGYVSSVLATDDAWWMCTSDDHGYHAGQEYGIICGSDLSHYYKRIGQYDFTKPKQPKEIKKLPDGYGDGYVLYKSMTEVDGTVENGWVSIGVLSSKINELVDAVNELRNK